MMLLKPPQDRVNHFKKHLPVPKNVWDPLNAFTPLRIRENCAKLEASFERLQNDSNFLGKFRMQTWLFGIFALLAGIGLSFLFNSLMPGIYGVMICIGSIVVSIIYLRNLSKDLIKFGIAKKENWVYDPDVDTMRARDFILKFPEIFKKGTRNHEVEDQFWGTYKKVEFHSGLFRYVIQRGRDSTRVQTHYYAIKMKSPLKQRFHLYPENFGSKLANLFTKKQISTESIAFNKAFAFSYDGKREEKALDIVATLTPAVQQQLVDLKRKKKLLEVLFTKDCIIFLFSGVLLKKLETNLAKSLEISKNDVDKVRDELQSVLDVSETLVDILS